MTSELQENLVKEFEIQKPGEISLFNQMNHDKFSYPYAGIHLENQERCHMSLDELKVFISPILKSQVYDIIHGLLKILTIICNF